MKYLLAVISLALFAAALGNRDYPLALLALALPAVAAVRARLARREEKRNAVIDSATVIEAVLLVWQLASANFQLADPVLFPPPTAILALFFAELGDMLRGLLSSSYLLGSAYGLALATVIPAGIAVESSRRLRAAAEPFSRVLGAIPPIVYIPYAIALLPSFRSASIFVIWSGAFWPVFVNTVSGVVTIPDSLLDSARMLHLKRSVFFFRILLPGAMPSILTGRFARADFQFSPADCRRADRSNRGTRLVCEELFRLRGLRTGDRRHPLYRNRRHFADVAFQQTGAQAAALPEEYT